MQSQAEILLKGKHRDEPISPQLRELLESIGTIRKIEKDGYIFHEGEEAHDIYIIQSGIVQMSKLAANGKELILRICKKNDLIGELTLFSDNPAFLLSAKILEPGEVIVINKDKLERALLENSMLTFEFMKWTSNHMRKFQSKIRDLLLNGKKGALYSTLIRLVNSYGIEHKDGWLINISFTNQELANFCAATRESVNRMLAELRKKDKIAVMKNGEILVKDLDYLKDEIGCEGCPIEICNIN
ncbi:Crp/Fnr family transcriptional regulator [Ornithinibacillus halophilus]|uniref:CRP/FNR family transcriptional regulator, anaerobic regulatory protein n=1 Tax=Ornithinibacillus halophilus TaxID=930117 RepID=A0A1M5IIS6_9BACI|nr:Crp/Fnr family transcriptional regulator [Ornithinibacillus halophilus]SHG27949.1 CRP/FNR family transcriptional regulator, anaerobic regulatory protein [Ornithinibacillus halophilus]